jgi:hypothetical protein
MSLRAQAEADLAATLTAPSDFGIDITLINPEGDSLSLRGQTGDISRTLDPETGQQVIARLAHVAVRISDLGTLGIPVAVQDRTRKPWVCSVTGIDGETLWTRIVEAIPDRTLGCVVLLLERYIPGT